MNHRILESIKEAVKWLVETRKAGQWQDLVYKNQGIINTCEAWHTLAMAKQIFKSLKLPTDLFEQDLDYLLRKVKKHSFVRTPYQPENQKQESTDAAAFVILALDNKDNTKTNIIIVLPDEAVGIGDEWTTGTLLDTLSSRQLKFIAVLSPAKPSARIRDKMVSGSKI